MSNMTRAFAVTLFLSMALVSVHSFSIHRPHVAPTQVRPTKYNRQRGTQRYRIHPLSSMPQADDDPIASPVGLTRTLRPWRRALVSLVLASTPLVARPSHAEAVPVPVVVPEKSTVSIRPGMSLQQVEALEQGDRSVMDELVSSSALPTPAPASSTSLYDDDEDDDLLDTTAPPTYLMQSSKSTGTGRTQGTTATRGEMAEQRLQSSSTKDTFAAYHKGKSKRLYVQVGLAFFVPTYGFMMGREFVRRRREEQYVQKGLEILAAQRAEYFNVTQTSSDADVQDALSNLKNTTRDDDDDDDSDDDTPEPPPRRPPRKPLGDPPSGGGTPGSGGTGGDGDKPSQAEIDKLNKLLGKS